MRKYQQVVTSICSKATRRYLSSTRAVNAANKIGFIGLGQMGSRMAVNLVSRHADETEGRSVHVLDMNDQAVEACVGQGAVRAESVQAIAKECDVVVTMLPSSKQVMSVYTDEDGLVPNAKEDALFIDCTTLEPDVAKSVWSQASDRSVQMVDAPVSGGVGGAEAATLSFMVGGTDDAFERANPILSFMGKNIVHCGESGSGQVAKICNNLVLAISMIGLNEGYNLALSHGMDAKIIADIFNSSSAQSWSSNYVGPPGTKDYSTGFKVSLMKKDLGLAMKAAEQAGVKLPLGEMSGALYTLLEVQDNRAHADKDFSYIFEYLRTLNDKQ